MTALSADRPSIDPENDLFGHAPFAKNLALSISRYPSNDGLVLALYGPWGSGKSTVLNYIQHYLDQQDEDKRPVVVTFNPWWFSGQENLARAFLGQMQAILPNKSEKFKKLGDLFSNFSESIGGLIDLTGTTLGAGSLLGKMFANIKRKNKDVPALKAEINQILLKANQRILIIIDDIDRLTPEETRQLFTVIKALADFQNVVYLMALDREVAVKAIEDQTGMPGERYLEKIIQVPFEIPPVDRTALIAAFTKQLDNVIIGTPDGLFEQAYWINVLNDGIAPFIQVPRDIVRFINTMAVTYPAVVDEVNPVDFIAIEALRVFLPRLYDVIRSNPDHFAGHKPDRQYGGSRDNTTQEFHAAWQKNVPENLQASTKALIKRIFPKTDDMSYGGEWIAVWRKSQRICVPDLFPIYFRLSIADGDIKRSEILDILNSVITPNLFGEKLCAASLIMRPDGLSKARAILERLMDYVEQDILAEYIPIIINELLNIGDKLSLPSDNTGGFDLSNEQRIGRIVYHLLKRVEITQRSEYLKIGFDQGQAIGTQSYLLGVFWDEITMQLESNRAMLLDSNIVDELKTIWVEKIRKTDSGELLSNSQFSRILLLWQKIGSAEEEVNAWCTNVVISDEKLLIFLSHFLTQSRGQTFGDSAVNVQPRLNPKWIEEYLEIDVVAEKLQKLESEGQVPESATVVVSQFLKEFKMLKNGKNPDGMWAFDD